MDKELATYHPESSSVVVYHSDDDAAQLEVQLSEETVWLTQKQMSWLFDTTSQITKFGRICNSPKVSIRICNSETTNKDKKIIG